jgi:hypothetical protein
MFLHDDTFRDSRPDERSESNFIPVKLLSGKHFIGLSGQVGQAENIMGGWIFLIVHSRVAKNAEGISFPLCSMRLI